MSTRCQVQVIGSGYESGEQVTLYHHTDGYPSYMVPTIRKAYRRAIKPTVYRWKDGSTSTYENAWHAGRVGKSAGYLCWADPGTFEPEPGQQLHSDIEYLYRVYLCGSRSVNGSVRPTWEVEVLATARGFWDRPTVANMTVVYPRTEIKKLARQVAWDERKRRAADAVSA